MSNNKGEFSLLEESTEDQEDRRVKRPWKERYFSSMKSGSLRGSTFMLASTAMGAGYLAIPQVLQKAGLFLGLAIIAFCGALMYFSLITVTRAAFKCKNFHYPSVCEFMLGRGWAILLEIAIIVNAVGLIIALNIIVGLLMPTVFSSLNIKFERILERDLIIVILNCAVIAPFGLLRNLGALRFKAFFNVICLTYVMIVVIVEFPFYAQKRDYSNLKYAAVDINFFDAFALGMFAYLCHQNVTKVQGELNNSNQRRIDKVAFRAIMIMGVIFSILSLFGYLSFLNGVPNIIVMRHSIFDNDWAMVVGRVLISLTMTVAIIINLYPCRSSMEKLFFKVQGRSPTWLHAAITLTTIGVTMLVAIFFPDINFVFSVLGGFCAAVMGLIIPALLYIKLSQKPMTSPSNLAIITTASVLTAVGFTSIVLGIVRQF
uniref:Amino acid transporter transmembrane domain-containing protein n=1 Tax=Fabrea salina TaxID=342563 RepID=A0A7S3I8N0_9CILI|mmetsp:Transcript_111/g.204  ORF Transcript_111/g.204 Transcript_111/m.204 type:complete len:430 (+) Transcript_111:25-1314(+)